MRLTRTIAVVGALTATAVLALAVLAHDAGPASAAGPGMSLRGPAPVPVTETFTISVDASPAPGVDFGAFGTEVVFPAGLTWVQRTNCGDEVPVTAGGSPPLICMRSAGPSGEARHVVNSGFLPPLPAFDTQVSTLLELDVRCDAPGNHTIVLTAVPGSSFGAIYFDTMLAPIPVKTVSYDVDGDTTPDNVAGTVTVDCLDVPTRTPTTAPTSTSTPSPTATASPTLPPTSTPTLTPTATASLTPTATPTATPTPTTEQAIDSDGDGCTDAAEGGPDEVLGGRRDHLSFWDFFDVPAGGSLTRDKQVTAQDIFAVLGRFNASDGGPGDFYRNDDVLSTPNQFVEGADRANYHPAYDRGPLVGPNPWNLGPPDGAIASLEIFAVIAQFNHSCA